MECKNFKIHTVNLLNSAVPDCKALFNEEAYRANIPTSRLCLCDCFYVCQIVEGSAVYCVIDQEIPCNAGDIYIVPPNTPHGFFLADENEGLSVSQLFFDLNDWFEGDLVISGEPNFCYGLFNDNAVFAYARLNKEVQMSVDGIFDKIEVELSEKQQNWREAIRACLTQFFIVMSRYISHTIRNDTPTTSKDWRFVLSAMRMVKSQYSDRDFTLKTLSDTFYISQSHLSRLFKSLTGQLFSEYLRDVRIENACRLLKETDMKVEEIIEACGMADIPSFYRNFAEKIGMTPRQYRQGFEKEKIIKKKGNIIMSILMEISENLQKGKAKLVKELVQKALDEGSNPEQILNEGLLHGMGIIGEKFKNNEVYVPEVLVAARAMDMGTQILKPHLAQAGVEEIGKVCIGTVQGDLHDIGKNLVKMMMEGKGLEVIDLGTDVSPEAFVNAAVEQDCKVICCSALLTTTMDVMADVVKAAEAAGIRDKVKIMVGGAPVTDEFCRQIGADCYTSDAASAADAAVALCNA